MSNIDVNPELELGEAIETVPVELSEEDQAVEAQARRMGWRPEAEYTPGRSNRPWVDAKTFVERGMSELPVLRNRYRDLDNKFATVTKELDAMKTSTAEQSRVLLELREMSKNAEDRAYIRAARELSAREREAVVTADTAAYEAVQRERQDLEQHRPRPVADPPVRQPDPAPTTVAQQPAPEVQAWVRDNPWFTTDPVLNQVAIAFDSEVKREHPEWAVEDQLAEAKARVVARFPEKFGNPRRTAAQAVATSNNAPRPPKAKGVKDLPKEYQDAFARFQRQMPGYTEAEYLKTLGEM